MSIPQFKICPRCQTQAALQEPLRRTCGHTFRTQFAPPINQTQVINAPLYAPQPTRRSVLRDYFQHVVLGCLLIAALTLGYIHFVKHAHPLIGKWKDISSTETFEFSSEGTYTRSTWNESGKWYSSGDHNAPPNATAGTLHMLKYGDTYELEWVCDTSGDNLELTFKNGARGTYKRE